MPILLGHDFPCVGVISPANFVEPVDALLDFVVKPGRFLPKKPRPPVGRDSAALDRVDEEASIREKADVNEVAVVQVQVICREFDHEGVTLHCLIRVRPEIGLLSFGRTVLQRDS